MLFGEMHHHKLLPRAALPIIMRHLAYDIRRVLCVRRLSAIRRLDCMMPGSCIRVNPVVVRLHPYLRLMRGNSG